jgi:hypothetical protein
MKKEYYLKIFETKNGSNKSRILKEIYLTVSTKKEAFEEAKKEFFDYASYDFNSFQIKEEFEDAYKQTLNNNDDVYDLHDFFNDQENFDKNTLVDADDVGDLSADCFKFGDLSYSKDVYFYQAKIFSKKVKN